MDEEEARAKPPDACLFIALKVKSAPELAILFSKMNREAPYHVASDGGGAPSALLLAIAVGPNSASGSSSHPGRTNAVGTLYPRAPI